MTFPTQPTRSPRDRRGPLRVMFVITSVPVGGQETLLVSLIRGLDRRRCLPELCCLKEPGPLGEELDGEIPVFSRLISGKFDARVWPRLSRLMRLRGIDAVVTVGAGDKMFWGRLAAWTAGVPVVMSALHTTGWPDDVGRLNRWLTPLTDAFIAVAQRHAEFLSRRLEFPQHKVHVIHNGVDTDRFGLSTNRDALRSRLGIAPATPVVGILAALRPEKNHELFLAAAKIIRERVADAAFLIVGDGPRREHLEQLTERMGLGEVVRFLGTRGDVPELLAAMDVVALTSRNEASPVSLLEAMACGRPVVTTRVGSIAESVTDGQSGFLVEPGDARAIADRVAHLLETPRLATQMGSAGRRQVQQCWSLERMVDGYQQLIERIYDSKCDPKNTVSTCAEIPENEERYVLNDK